MQYSTQSENTTMSTNPDEIRIAVFPCDCGVNIAGVIDMEALTEYAKTLPNVVIADKNLSL